VGVDETYFNTAKAYKISLVKGSFDPHRKFLEATVLTVPEVKMLHQSNTVTDTIHFVYHGEFCKAA
jgi:hypothetical protein